MFTCTLECGHKVTWQEDAFTPGAHLPHEGLLVFCAECSEDQEIDECEPQRVVTETVLVSENEPGQTQAGSSGMAYTPGEKAIIFYDTRSGSWGFCYTGVSSTGLGYESEDETGFPDAASAWAHVFVDLEGRRKEEEYMQIYAEAMEEFAYV